MDISSTARLPRGAIALAAVRFLLYLGVQAAYFIGVIGTLTYELEASTAAIALAVGLFNLFIILGNACGGSLLDTRGPAVHTLVALATAAATSFAFQLVSVSMASVLAMSAGFGLATGLGFTFLSSYPAYLTIDTEELKRANALLSVVSNAAVVVGPTIGGIIATVLPAQRVFVFAGVLAILGVLPAAVLLRRIGGAPAAERALGRADDEVSSAGTFADSARAVFSVPSLALLFLVGVLAYAGYGAFDPLESLYYRDVLQVEISWMGWLSSAAGVGSVAGAMLAMRVPHRLITVRTLMLLIAAEGAACILYVGTDNVICAICGQVLLGCAFGMVTPLQNTLVQINAPLSLLGRVNSVMNAGFNGAGVLPLFAAPVLADLFGVQAVLVGASCVVLAVPLIALVLRLGKGE
ncbi:MFS transporter [Collinsella tanakaei]|uniref:MFS transporter n=1 Tax=Collinsella tanakaei TaxID=626935 RepID=UPI00195693D6|nr:MFS transporter [Collinsella tanakaei]MBM6756190.1 MFS transporter [Collinsella tanakaei]